MFILIFLPVYLSIFFVVDFKILVISVSNMDDSAANLGITVYTDDYISLEKGELYLSKGKGVMALPKIVNRGKINDLLIDSNNKSFI